MVNDVSASVILINIYFRPKFIFVFKYYLTYKLKPQYWF